MVEGGLIVAVVLIVVIMFVVFREDSLSVILINFFNRK